MASVKHSKNGIEWWVKTNWWLDRVAAQNPEFGLTLTSLPGGALRTPNFGGQDGETRAKEIRDLINNHAIELYRIFQRSRTY